MGDNEKVQVIYSGISLPGLLGVVFITLKLCGVIDWSWLWVLSPFWIPFVFTIGFLSILMFFSAIGFGIITIFEYFSKK